MKLEAIFDVFRAGAGDHFIDGSMVGCPVRGCDVGIDTCAACPWLIEIDQNGARPVVRCLPQSAPARISWLGL